MYPYLPQTRAGDEAARPCACRRMAASGNLSLRGSGNRAFCLGEEDGDMPEKYDTGTKEGLAG